MPSDPIKMLEEYVETAKKLEKLEAQLKSYVELTGEPIEIEGAVAKVAAGRGSYDWEVIASDLRVPAEVLEAHKKYDFKAACEAVGVPAAVKAARYKAGAMKFKIEIAK